jgi:hypothetical protein
MKACRTRKDPPSMRAKFALAFLLLAVIGLCKFAQPSVAALAAELKAKKLIYYGWRSPNTEYVREQWREMEKMPFDGVGIIVAVNRRTWQQGKRETHNQLAWQIMGKKTFRVEDFRDAINDLKAAKWSKFTDNFLPVILSAEQSTIGLNWFDDARWRTVVNNFEVLARVAAETGVKGLIFDPEHYNYALFDYNEQRGQLAKPIEAYREIARQRGREVARAITNPLPQAVILSLYSYTYPLIHTLPKTPYNLLPAFYDGLLEALPSGATLVDGFEPSYAYKEARQFAAGYQQIHDAVKISEVPEHYKKKVKAGFGLWIDYQKKPNHFTGEEFRRAVTSALETSDGYVWIYSETVGFFPPYGLDRSYIEALAAAHDTKPVTRTSP